MRNTTLLIALLVHALLRGRAAAYPEFQRDLVQRTGRPVNCAFCHTHADGPEGTGFGQLGRLTPAEFEALGRARAAFEPGAGVQNPILNAFGNHIVNSIGKRAVTELKLAPDQLATGLPPDGDLDHDGIPDAREYREGTHPLLHGDGNPWILFRHRFERNLGQIALTLAATVLGLYGLRHLLVSVAATARLHTDDDEHREDTHP